MYPEILAGYQRMTHQIAEALQKTLHPHGVAVFVEGSHLYARRRGVRQSEADLATSCMLGVFEQEGDLRYDFLQRLKLRSRTLED
jgi:GTP cyclohydrolase I